MTLRLRPHHIERIIELEKKSYYYNGLFSTMMRLIYGAETYKDYKNSIKRARDGEEISLTREIGQICSNCPYQQPCINDDITAAYSILPWPFRMLGFELSNTKDKDDEAIKRLGLDETKTYFLDDLLNL